MCVIIDANVAAEIIGNKPILASREFSRQVIRNNVRVAIGGKLRFELAKISGFLEWANRLQQADLWFSVPDGEVDELTLTLQTSGILESDDAHVLALAQRSGARLLYSKDQNLHEDFKNSKLINNPRGKIYQNETHKHLLVDRALCRSC